MIKELSQEKVCGITTCFQAHFIGQEGAPSSWVNCKIGILENARRSIKKGDQKIQDGCAHLGAVEVARDLDNITHGKRNSLKAESSCTWEDFMGLEALTSR